MSGIGATVRRHPLWAILALALALRLLWAMLVPVLPLSDSAMYDGFARGIAAGEGYHLPGGAPTAYWPVGTAALYAIVYRILGTAGVVVAATNILLGAALVAATFVLARRHFGPAVAVIAGVAAAIWPMWIAFTTVISSELPFTLVLVLALLARGDARRPLWLRSLLSSALIVLASFFRPTLLLLVVVLPVLDLIAHRSPRRLALDLAIALVTATALVAPWAIRNDRVMGAPVPVSTNLGVNLWLGNHDGADGSFQDPPPTTGLGEVAQDLAYRQQAKAWIMANPGGYLRLTGRRAIETFNRESIHVYWNERGLRPALMTPIKLASTLYWWLVFGLSLIGVAVFLRERFTRLFDPLIVVPAGVAAASLLIMASDRFHMPMMPFVATFAGVAIVRLRDRLAGRSKEA